MAKSKFASFAKRRSLKGGVVRRSTSVATLKRLGIREINSKRSTMTGA